ncbi:DUF6602 domain-containing protein [Roseomonas rosulenta]|uniref:DUF6602 domain-containing protein n=1 Tax=Roseomonas rosulenta TaxID=2748667 RepID=UPI0018DFE7A0|nr:DUF6602 domain-containing protein [Roseomonas rosulenta]
MTKRHTQSPSNVFSNVLNQAETRLALDASGAENFEHRGIKGNERALALADFLRSHLPSIFAVGKGEAIDFKDNRSGELDLFLYDRMSAAPIQSSSENILVPAEAIYAVIEVKSILTGDEIEKCLNSAKKVRALRPFKEKFLPAATDGKTFENHFRCPYYVFAYRSNLSEKNWAQKEFDRIKASAKLCKCEVDVVDRVFVLDRGIIHPQARSAVAEENPKGLFLEFYVHLMNFLTRERGRRPPIDWMAYAKTRKWARLV